MTENIHTRLHRFHDDDLSPEEKAELEKELAANPELGKKLEGLREVGAVVRAARTDDVPIDSDILWSAIEGKIASPVEAKPALRAIEGGAPKTAPVAEDPRTRRRRIIGIAVGAFAIAAAALLMIYGPPSTEPDTIAEPTLPEVTAPEETAPEETVAATDYTEVLAVDFGTNVGTIFAVEGESGQRYAVVWLDDVLKRDEGDVPAEERTPN